MLNADQKAVLLKLAHTSVASRVLGQPPFCVDEEGMPEVSGVFVTIKHRGELRGCLGTLSDGCRLAEEVVRCAANSASEDPRFAAISADELPELRLEVSVLGRLERIDALPNAFTVGIHGLVVELGGRRGLLLPQVATEWGWTPVQFLRQTCVKAGLAPDAWQHGADVYRFAAEVFGD